MTGGGSPRESADFAIERRRVAAVVLRREDMIPLMIDEIDMGVCAAPTLPEGECTTYGLYPAVEPAALHHQH